MAVVAVAYLCLTVPTRRVSWPGRRSGLRRAAYENAPGICTSLLCCVLGIAGSGSGGAHRPEHFALAKGLIPRISGKRYGAGGGVGMERTPFVGKEPPAVEREPETQGKYPRRLGARAVSSSLARGILTSF